MLEELDEDPPDEDEEDEDPPVEEEEDAWDEDDEDYPPVEEELPVDGFLEDEEEVGFLLLNGFQSLFLLESLLNNPAVVTLKRAISITKVNLLCIVPNIILI